MAPTYRHIIWDWNGTLLDDAWLCIEVLNELLKQRGRAAIDTTVYREHFGFPVIHFYEFLGFDFKEDPFDLVSRQFIDAYEARWLSECALHKATESTLRHLSNLGLEHSILSAAEQNALETGIQHFGLKAYFQRLVGADNIFARGKIERGIALINDLPVPKDQVVLIGDTLHDHEVATAMGIDCLLLAHGHHNEEKLLRAGVPVIHNHDDLVTHLL